jgi:hypothetical protein
VEAILMVVALAAVTTLRHFVLGGQNLTIAEYLVCVRCRLFCRINKLIFVSTQKELN